MSIPVDSDEQKIPFDGYSNAAEEKRLWGEKLKLSNSRQMATGGSDEPGKKRSRDEELEKLIEASSGKGSSESVSGNQSQQNIPRCTPIMDISEMKEIVFPPTAATGDFSQMGTKSGTDKVYHHGYNRFYPRALEQYRNMSGGSMLEIGIDQKASLTTWLEYFPHAFIYGIDIGVSAEGERHRIFTADQSDTAQLENIVQNEIKHPVFFILDDGSHIPEHQTSSFNYLFNHLLLPGGTYIVEDIETSYWSKNGLYGYETRYGYHHKNSVLEKFKLLLDEINCEFLNSEARREQERIVSADFSPQV